MVRHPVIGFGLDLLSTFLIELAVHKEINTT